jgi:SAM-dependent methyltransferase
MSGGFSSDWLALREPYDRRARNQAVLDAAAAALKSCSPVRVVDLACGTGSTLRALSPHLQARQNWKLVDHDPGLLAHAMATPLAKDVSVAAIPLDINRDLETALDGTIDLVATSALLDLRGIEL